MDSLNKGFIRWLFRVTVLSMVLSAVVVPATPAMVEAQALAWGLHSAPTSENLDGLAWGGGKFVAVGTGGVVLTSPDGVSWFKHHSGTGQHLHEVAWSGNRFVAVGLGGTIIISTDGIHWSTIPCPAPSQNLRSVTWSGLRFVAVGDNGKIITSTDGLSWINLTGPAAHLNGVTSFGHNKFVAVGLNGSIIHTTDGINWASQPSGTSTHLFSVTWNGSQFVAVGSMGTILSSSNGTAWHNRSLPTTDLYDITWGSGRYMAVGNGMGGDFLTSTDGLAWSQVLHGTGTTADFYDVVWNGSAYVAVGHAGNVLRGFPGSSTPPPGTPPPAPGSRTTSRIYGGDRYQTAVEVSKAGWPSAQTVLITRGDEYADALAGVPLAFKYNSPILLTQSGSLNADTKKEIQRLGATNAVILGGTLAVSQAVEDALKVMGLNVSRIWGPNRYATAAEIARQAPFAGVSQAFIVYGHDFPDALLASPFAAVQGKPILLVHTENVPPDTASALSSLGITSTVVVGNNTTIKDHVLAQLPSPVRVSGANRYAAAVAVLNHFSFSHSQLHVATGLKFPDSMTGGVLAAKRNSALILVSDVVPPEIRNYLSSKPAIQNLVIFGGPAAVSAAVENGLK